ncbi:MAG: ATP synthase F1 subunit delta [Myxococcota bacterium]|jgi:F-type H+-transporting ATPase subunit delta|nr:ATP synthase F1 subunit delta [Myxococcota bacterium]
MSSKAALRYAKAVFALGRESQELPALRMELNGLADLLKENSNLREVLLTPLHPADERKAVLRGLASEASFSSTLQNFAAYLIDRRRLIDLPEIVHEFNRLADEDEGLLTAQVRSASPLDEDREQRLQRALSDRTGRRVRLEVELDPSLIGGAIATVGDLVIDGSLRTQLSQLRANLMKGS